MQDLIQRFNHPHYHLNNVLSIALPLLLFRELDFIPTNMATISICLWSPLFHGLFYALGDKGSKAPLESLHASYTFNLRRYSLLSLVYASWTNKIRNGWYWIGIYSLCWLATSFFFPQPPYLGPKNLKPLTTDEFDEQILLVPSARSAAEAFANLESSSSRIVELPEDDTPSFKPTKEMRERWKLVLFHAEWISKSRELEYTLSRLSSKYSSPHLTFSLITPEENSSTFYDLGLSTSPTSTELPIMRMYRNGEVVEEAPLSAREARKRRGKRGGAGSGEEEDEEGDSGDEREVERMRGMDRYKWDRSARSIERTFKLKERSGLYGADGRLLSSNQREKEE